MHTAKPGQEAKAWHRWPWSRVGNFTARISLPALPSNSQQKTFEAFRREYNEERPHESLGQRPPAGSSRVSFTVLPEQRGYADQWEKRMVRKAGQMKWKGDEILVSSILREQGIG